MSPARAGSRLEAASAALAKQVNPPEGFKLPVIYGDIGPKVIAAGGIDEQKFVAWYHVADATLWCGAGYGSRRSQ